MNPASCPCSQSGLGNYATEASRCTPAAPRMARFTGQDARSDLLFGRQPYEGHYGKAFLLRFPRYLGAHVEPRLRAHDHAVPDDYRYGLPLGTPIVLVGNPAHLNAYHVLPQSAPPAARALPPAPTVFDATPSFQRTLNPLHTVLPAV